KSRFRFRRTTAKERGQRRKNSRFAPLLEDKLALMHYLVIERFKDAPAIYQRLSEKGRMMPEGLTYVSSWIDHNLKTCWQVTDTGPTPYDLLLAALESFTSMTIGFYARKRSWPLESITVSLRHSKIHATECEECETKEGKIDRIELDIQLIGSLTAEQRAKLIEIAGKCPVHQTLTSEINIKTRAI